MAEYMKRIIDGILTEYLEVFGAVLLVGPKWCGKTTTAKQQARSVIQLQDPAKAHEYMKMIDVNPSLILKGDTPLLLDEWQTAPTLWDSVRTEVDNRNSSGQFILTGSAVPVDNSRMHTGTGRIARVKMYPMSLYESKESNGNISLEALFNGITDINGISSFMRVEDIAYVICRGGWPASIGKSARASFLITSSYVDALCESDVSRVDESMRNPQRIRSILRSYARNVSTLVTKATIRKDVIANDQNISETTFFSYLNALERLFVIEDIPAWNPAIRSKTAIRSGTKRGFVDPSLACASLGLTYEGLMQDLNTLGFLFESLVIRDLRIYSQHLGGEISYYHDRYGLECDAVLHLRDGRYALIEMKLGSREIEEGASHLRKLKALIQEHNLKEPSFLMVITGGQFAYRREDGVLIVPIGCLKP